MSQEKPKSVKELRASLETCPRGHKTEDDYYEDDNASESEAEAGPMTNMENDDSNQAAGSGCAAQEAKPLKKTCMYDSGLALKRAREMADEDLSPRLTKMLKSYINMRSNEK